MSKKPRKLGHSFFDRSSSPSLTCQVSLPCHLERIRIRFAFSHSHPNLNDIFLRRPCLRQTYPSLKRALPRAKRRTDTPGLLRNPLPHRSGRLRSLLRSLCLANASVRSSFLVTPLDSHLSQRHYSAPRPLTPWGRVEPPATLSPLAPPPSLPSLAIRTLTGTSSSWTYLSINHLTTLRRIFFLVDPRRKLLVFLVKSLDDRGEIWLR